MTTEEKRVKPMKCQWCGTRPKVCNVEVWLDIAVVVRCESRRCPVNPRTHPCDHRGKRRSRDEAITSWNTRKL